MRRFVLLFGLAVTLTALAACGGSDGDSDATAPAPVPAQVPPAPPQPPPEPEPPPPAPDPPPPPEPDPPPPEPEPPPPPELAEGLPEDIAGYEAWVRLNPEPIPPIAGGDAHNGTKDVFTNLEADRSGGGVSYPGGTIIVKESIRPDRDFVGLVAIMRKIEGFDPANNDWEFVEYTRTAPNDIFTLVASGGVCTGCHIGAAETDFVWVHTTGDAP